MRDLFLRSVELSNFRIYGDSYLFRVPSGPGVTLITGGNGLGKTSFFDGVEWALTSRVSRFDEMPMDGRRNNIDPLTRIGAPEGSHRVSVAFSDGSVIDRGAGFDVSEREIVELLKRPEWASISSLHGYLSLTHFFGQASAQRFSLKKPTEQWEALKGPAGVDRINTLRERLGGIGVRRAFTRAIDDRRAKLELARADLTSWEQLTGERDRARQLASSERAMSPPELRAEVDKLAARVVDATGRDTWTSSADAEAPEALLDALSVFLQSAQERSRAAVERINELSRVVDVYAAARSETATIERQVREIEARLATLREALRTSDEELAEVDANLRSCETDASRANGRLVALRRAAALSTQLQEAGSREDAQRVQLAAIEAASAHIDINFELLRNAHAEAMALRAERRSAAERLTLAQTRAKVFADLRKVEDDAAHLSGLAATRDVAHWRSTRIELVQATQAARARCAEMTSELQAHDERARGIVEAVGAIAHRLTHDDTSCPVCTTSFAAGELLRLVRDPVRVNASPASNLASELAKAQVDLGSLERQIRAADAELAAMEEIEASLSRCRVASAELRQQLVDAGGAPDGYYDDRSVAALERELKRLDQRMAEHVGLEDLAAQIVEKEAARAAESAKKAAAAQLLVKTSEEIQSIRVALLQYPDVWDPEKGALLELAVELERSERDAQVAGEVLSVANGAAEEARRRRDALRAKDTRETVTLSVLKERAAQLSQEQQSLCDRWIAGDQEGQPDRAVLSVHANFVAATASRLEAFEDAFHGLLTGYRKWREDEQLLKLENGVRAKIDAVGTASEADCHAHLVRLVETAKKDLDLATSTKEKVDVVGASMQELTQAYASSVLEPLNATIQRFARTLMTFSDTAVTYRADHHKMGSELRPNILRSSVSGAVSKVDMNPGHYFSEGQLSALSVAALLAASTTFGWSRWRGLLLDDPLQHNDVIHASAFMDLLRQMVLGLDYQIVMSTHDSAEAEFLSRKCRSAGIPYLVHELTPQGPAGLVTPEAATPRWAQA